MSFPKTALHRSKSSIHQNKLLTALPSGEYAKIQPHLERVYLKRGELIHMAVNPVQYVYFPENCIVSSVTIFADGTSMESGLVGCRGMTGASVVLSRSAQTRGAFVQIGGQALRMKTGAFCQALADNRMFRQLATEYALAFFEQVAQTGACSNHHNLVHRIARLLMMCRDGIGGNEIFLTHESIAQMLGAHRPNTTAAITKLREKKLIIRSNRGVIRIIDQEGLRSNTCECYETINKIYRYYFSMLKDQSLNQAVIFARQQHNEQVYIQREGVNLSRLRVHGVQNLLGRIRTLKGDYSMCRSCHYICDQTGHWRSIEFYKQKNFDLTITPDLCPDCEQMKVLSINNSSTSTLGAGKVAA